MNTSTHLAIALTISSLLPTALPAATTLQFITLSISSNTYTTDDPGSPTQEISSFVPGGFDYALPNPDNSLANGRGAATASSSMNVTLNTVGDSLNFLGYGQTFATASASAGAEATGDPSITVDFLFTLQVAGTYWFEGAFEATDTSPNDFHWSYAQLRNYNNNALLFRTGRYQDNTEYSSGPFTGELAPGILYNFSLSCYARADANATINSNPPAETASTSFSDVLFTVTPVPEPSGLILALAGAAALATRRNRQKK